MDGETLPLSTEECKRQIVQTLFTSYTKEEQVHELICISKAFEEANDPDFEAIFCRNWLTFERRLQCQE